MKTLVATCLCLIAAMSALSAPPTKAVTLTEEFDEVVDARMTARTNAPPVTTVIVTTVVLARSVDAQPLAKVSDQRFDYR